MDTAIELNGILRAVKEAGSQTQLARALGVTQQAISIWLHQGYAPPDRAREIEMLYGVPRASLVSPKLLSMIDAGGGL